TYHPRRQAESRQKAAGRRSYPPPETIITFSTPSPAVSKPSNLRRNTSDDALETFPRRCADGHRRKSLRVHNACWARGREDHYEISTLDTRRSFYHCRPWLQRARAG